MFGSTEERPPGIQIKAFIGILMIAPGPAWRADARS